MSRRGRNAPAVRDVSATIKGKPVGVEFDGETGIARLTEKQERNPDGTYPPVTLNYRVGAEDLEDDREDAREDSDGLDDLEASDIRPALALGEWELWRHQRVNPVTLYREIGGRPPIPDNLVKTIAIANDQLPDEDPRKFTRSTLELLRRAAALADLRAPDVTAENQLDGATIEKLEAYSDLFAELHAFADVLEALLPPDGAEAKS
jgi:hypothetical protein